MSAINFHSQKRTTTVRGMERHAMARLLNTLAIGVADIDDSPAFPSWLRQVVPADHYCQNRIGSEFAESARIAIAADSMKGLRVGKKTYEMFAVILNTALAVGNESVKLAARLHGQCEIHAWVDGPDREWLAGVIERTVECGIFRRGMGWNEVVAHLREDQASPIVTSYSVCDTFPSLDLFEEVDARKYGAPVGSAERKSDDYYDLLSEWWDTVPESRSWEIGMEVLRATEGKRHLQLVPERFDRYRFDHRRDFIWIRQSVEKRQTRNTD